MTKEILESAKAVFCANAFLCSSALGPKVGDKRELWPATTVVMDEAGCANPGKVIMPVITFASTLHRFVLAGDLRQLSPFTITKGARQLYKVLTFEHLMKQNFPMTLLNQQFRTHSNTYDLVHHVVYENKIGSVIQTTQPLEALKNLLKSFPLPFTVGSRTFKVTTFINFIDVDDVKKHISPKGSSSNAKEVDTVSAFVGALKGIGKKASDICVMSGYSSQAKALRQRAQADNWNPVKVCTIDSTQGQEWDIVILSLAKTQRESGFFGTGNPANVACSRHRSALCLVGNWQFWNATLSSGNKYMDLLLHHMVYTSGSNLKTKRPSLCLNLFISCTTAALTLTFPRC